MPDWSFWRRIINMRHILVHGYCQIDNAVLWGTIQEDLEPLKMEVERILREDNL